MKPAITKTSITRKLLATAACAVTLLGASAASPAFAQPAQPLKFKWGAPTADYFVLYVAIDQGLFKKAGLDPQFYWFPTGAPLLAGLKSGDIDVFTTGLATVFALGQKIPLTFIGWEVDTSAGEGLVVSTNSPVKSYRDLAKAKSVAVASGTCAQVAFGLAARKAGVSPKNVNVVNLAPPLQANAFRSGAIDAGFGWAPYPQLLETQGHKTVNYDDEYGPNGGVCPSLYGARPQFLKEHPEVGHKLVQVRAEALALIEKNPELAVDALAKRLSISKEVARAALNRVGGANLPTLKQEITPGTRWSLVDQKAGLAAKLHVAGEILHETGTIPAPLTWEQINASIDSSYIEKFLKQGRQ
ncbi:NitT/TauT family transport system substrate-binding protein [Paucimonas lemoignei]|uniref:NitT/TauT family transport system substrate-binding protein n=1 Tax=Paucimonas lemoignei TaxID=29443 RepID=A0A4R3HXV4_PAULE|nr:ABC transporter substrate-binding protein [Paucimonas lemoignei]TCS38008.1 NitT/TauT family transport system substrate-binding protein [Paucimonas lemoignei]